MYTRKEIKKKIKRDVHSTPRRTKERRKKTNEHLKIREQRGSPIGLGESREEKRKDPLGFVKVI